MPSKVILIPLSYPMYSFDCRMTKDLLDLIAIYPKDLPHGTFETMYRALKQLWTTLQGGLSQYWWILSHLNANQLDEYLEPVEILQLCAVPRSCSRCSDCYGLGQQKNSIIQPYIPRHENSCEVELIETDI